jgi:protein involved in polysaccharide export with SLBB domain
MRARASSSCARYAAWIHVAWLALTLLGVGACASPPLAPPPPREVLNYRLLPGDVIEIKVFGAPELDQTVPVRPDGRISVAPFQDFFVEGLTVERVDELITRELSQIFDQPQVTLVVREFAGRNVYIGGEVQKPGLVTLRDGMTSVMAIFEAGGFEKTAQTTNVVIVRAGEGGVTEVVKMDLKRVLDDGLPDLVLQPFDVVYVPKSKIAAVNMFVEQYIKRMLPGDFVLVYGGNHNTIPALP